MNSEADTLDRAGDDVGLIAAAVKDGVCYTADALGGSDASKAYNDFAADWQAEAKTLEAALHELADKVRVSGARYQGTDHRADRDLRAAAGDGVTPLPAGAAAGRPGPEVRTMPAPGTVPPELPAPAVPASDGLTAAQVLWLLADHYELNATSTQDVYAELAALDEPVTVVVPDVDRAGPVQAEGEPARLVREVLIPLAATETVRLLAEVPRPLAAELAESLPPGAVQIIDLDEPEWADPEGLVLHAQAALNPEFGAPELPFTADPAARLALGAAIGRRAGSSPLVVQLAVHCIPDGPRGLRPSRRGPVAHLRRRGPRSARQAPRR